jgi:endonuclease YncB( thermonuclease family)
VRSPKHLLVWLIVIAVGAVIAQIVQDWRSQDWRSQDWRAPPDAPPKPTGSAMAGRARVIDGDSLTIGAARVRLFGIDAPEGKQRCLSAQSRSYACGEDARRALIGLIGGREVSCTPVGVSHDRSVAVCTAQGRDLSEALVRAGHALELRQHSRGRYAAAEREARDARRGLWAGDFERPSEWRRREMR